MSAGNPGRGFGDIIWQSLEVSAPGVCAVALGGRRLCCIFHDVIKKGPVKQRRGAVILSCAVDDAKSSCGATDDRVPESLALDGIRDDRFRDHSVLVR